MRFIDLFRHALLNLNRSKRRTIMIIFIIGASAGTLYMMNCYREFMFFGLRMSYADQSGHLQIAGRGYWDPKSVEKPIINAEDYSRIESLLISIPGIDRFTNRFSFQGLGGTAEKSDIINVTGVEIESYENKVRVLKILEGNMIGPEDQMSILIGQPVAERINVSPGDWMTLITTAVDGSFTFGEVQVAGIVSTGFSESDRYFGLTNLSFVQNLKGSEGVETILVYLEDENDLTEIMIELKEKAEASGVPIDIRDWISLNPYYLELDSLFRNMNFVVNAIVSILIFLAVLEILSMSFFERFRELGSLRAIGNTRAEILYMLLSEALLYAAIGIITGILFSHISGIIINRLDIQWMPPGNSSPAPFKFLLKLRFAVKPVSVVLSASLLAAVIPAIKGARLQVIEVLKHE